MLYERTSNKSYGNSLSVASPLLGQNLDLTKQNDTLSEVRVWNHIILLV